MKVAIGFFGLTRSLRYTIYSITTNIYNVFKANNIEYDVFIHTYSLSSYSNIRNKEMITDKEEIARLNNEYKLLKADYIDIHEQDEVKKKINMKLYRTHRDPFNSSYNSVDNFILAQYSKSKLVKLIEGTGNTYDYILFVRPDCLYKTPISINYLSHVNDNTICIPKYDLYGKYQFNDRFSITNMKTYKLYGETFRHLLYISRLEVLHSETIIGKLMKSHKLNIVKIPFKFTIVRHPSFRVKSSS